MDGIIRLNDSQRKSALEHFRFRENARILRRAHIFLLLDRGSSYREIMNAMFCSSDLVSDVKRRFLEEGLEAAVGIALKSAPEPDGRIRFVIGWRIRPLKISVTFEHVGLVKSCPRFCWNKIWLLAVGKRSVDGCIVSDLHGEDLARLLVHRILFTP